MNPFIDEKTVDWHGTYVFGHRTNRPDYVFEEDGNIVGLKKGLDGEPCEWTKIRTLRHPVGNVTQVKTRIWECPLPDRGNYAVHASLLRPYKQYSGVILPGSPICRYMTGEWEGTLEEAKAVAEKMVVQMIRLLEITA